MVANLGLRTNEHLYEEIDKIIAEMLSAWEKVECHEEVANHSQRIFILIKNNIFWGFSYIYDLEKKKNLQGTPNLHCLGREGSDFYIK